ncbi:MAG: hypothetical protein J7K62_04240 [Thermoplasmata archaeon]|nr:hypothetical protein [Thermoplasmata archaeon]
MVQPIPEELVKRIRDEVLSGKLKWQVAQELGVSYDTVKKYTRDLNHRIRSYRTLPSYLAREIRERVQNGESKYQVSRELGVSYQTVTMLTRDLPSTRPGFPGIRGKTLEAMQKLFSQGYILDVDPRQIRQLRKYFPEIKVAVIEKKHICYLDEKAKDAAMAFLKTRKKKVFSYQELKSITKVFGVKLESEEKKRFIGRKHKELPSENRSIKGHFGHNLKEAQRKLDDFLGRFLHSEVL